MKNFVKYLSVYLTVVMCLVSMVVMAVPGFAAEYEYEPVEFPDGSASYEILSAPDYWDEFGENVSDGNYSGVVYAFYGATLLEPGMYVFEGVALEQSSAMSSIPLKCLVLEANLDVDDIVRCEFGVPFEIATETTYIVMSQSLDTGGVLYRLVEAQPEGLYYEAYDMFRGFFYGLDIDLTTEQNMVLTILATAAVLFVVVMPFVAVFFLVKLICGR